MKLRNLLALRAATATLLSLVLITTSCKMQDDEEVFQSHNITLQALGDTIHVDSSQICGQVTQGILVDMLGYAGNDTNPQAAGLYGNWALAATPQNAIFYYQLGRGWFLTNARVYLGNIQAVPNDGKGGADKNLFPVQDTLALARNNGEILIPRTVSLTCPNTNVLMVNLEIFELDWLGNPYNVVEVGVQGTAFGIEGDQYVDWCAELCGTVTPTCEIPTPSPGDDLSEWYCGNGNGQQKVTVCHLPPGNPANMQEICIAVSALPAHVQEFKPINNPTMGHNSGCHIGPCDPCGPGSSVGNAGGGSGNGGNGGSNGGGNNGGWGGNGGGGNCGNGGGNNGGWGGNGAGGGNNGGWGGNGGGGNNGGWGGNGGGNGGGGGSCGGGNR